MLCSLDTSITYTSCVTCQYFTARMVTPDAVNHCLSRSPVECLRPLFLTFTPIWNSAQQAHSSSSKRSYIKLAYHIAEILEILDQGYRSGRLVQEGSAKAEVRQSDIKSLLEEISRLGIELVSDGYFKTFLHQHSRHHKIKWYGGRMTTLTEDLQEASALSHPNPTTSIPSSFAETTTTAGAAGYQSSTSTPWTPLSTSSNPEMGLKPTWHTCPRNRPDYLGMSMHGIPFVPPTYGLQPEEMYHSPFHRQYATPPAILCMHRSYVGGNVTIKGNGNVNNLGAG
ncbi:hypothetical protein BDZ97DRAFT_63987 [Flammula alnicola]|nr:hypothetical protein BDZ97DRAFT_63987 [Flammula alnicola]